MNLNTNSKLEYPENFDADTREVTLSGEAFFDIERDKTKPFIIHTDLANIEVLGTSFYVNVNQDNNRNRL